MAGARTCPIYRGAFALGFTLDETKRLIREALEQHLAAMRGRWRRNTGAVLRVISEGRVSGEQVCGEVAPLPYRF